MAKRLWLLLSLVLILPVMSSAASKQADEPDKELLRMMDFLKDWDVINNMEMIKDLQQSAPETQQPNPANRRATPPAPKKEAAK